MEVTRIRISQIEMRASVLVVLGCTGRLNFTIRNSDVLHTLSQD